MVQTWPSLQLFFLGNIRQVNVFYDIWERKNAFPGYKNKTFKKSKKRQFCKGVNPWIRFENCHFTNFFFLGNIGQENVFYDNLNRENAVFGYKSKKFKKSKNWHFPKGLSHSFGSKMAIFPSLFFRQYRSRKCLLWYSRTKKRLSRL